MKQLMLLSALVIAALGMASATSPATAAAGLPAPGGTPGAPPLVGTPTGTLQTGQGNGPPANVGQPAGLGGQNTPGAQATAVAGPHGQPTIYRGTISLVDATSLSLTLGDGSPINIGLTSGTRIKVPGPKAQGDTLLIGMQVVVQTIADSSSNPVARSVLAIPAQPSLAHRVGKVTAYAASSSITILSVDGNSYTFVLTADTRILPAGASVALDALVTVIAPRDPAGLGWTATGIVVHAQEH